MERKIKINRKGSESIKPADLVNKLYMVEWLGVVSYDPINDQTGFLTLKGADDYDVQEVGHIISSSGYAVIPYESKIDPLEVGFVKRIIRSIYNMGERMRELKDAVGKRLIERKDLSDFLKKQKDKQGTGIGSSPFT